MAEVELTAEATSTDLSQTFGIDAQLLSLAAVNEILHSYHVYLKEVLMMYRDGEKSIVQTKKLTTYIHLRMYNLVEIWLDDQATMRKEQLF